MRTPAQRTAWLTQFAASLRALDASVAYATAMQLGCGMWPVSYLLQPADAAQAWLARNRPTAS